jgi:hypothetical protein
MKRWAWAMIVAAALLAAVQAQVGLIRWVAKAVAKVAAKAGGALW